jgi:hypothetical protein
MEKLFTTFQDQSEVGFTGKVNLLRPVSKQYLGMAVFNLGELISLQYKGLNGLKAFYKVFIDLSDGDELDGIVEPEVVDGISRDIHYPLSKLREKLDTVITEYQASKSQRPPDHVKLLISAEFFDKKEDVSGEEFDLLCTISDFSKVSDIYFHSKLLEYEITYALVSLRKKGGLVVVK